MAVDRTSGKTKIDRMRRRTWRFVFSMSNPDSLRLSLDSDRASPLPTLNGHDSVDDELDPLARLQRDLDRTREEKDSLAAQYRNLLAKLTTMRTTLGNKLKQDAVRV